MMTETLSIKVPVQTKTRIEAAIKTLNYQPNPHARRLSMGRSDTIGLVVPDIANCSGRFFAHCLLQKKDK